MLPSVLKRLFCFLLPNPDQGGGDSGGSSGGSGAGGSGSGSGSGSTLTLAQAGAGSTMASTAEIPVVLSAADVAAARATSGPGRMVASDEVVEVAPIPTNTKNVAFATVGPAAAISGPRRILTPTSNPVRVNVVNLADIWVYGADAGGPVAGEGISISIRRG